MGEWLGTLSGKKIDLLNPDPDQIDINDIALALSRAPRFNGHTQGTWSVLQHSLAASALVADKYKLQTLLHDASEAYICDVPTPLKRLLGDTYRDVERTIMAAIGEHFQVLLVQLPDAVKLADSIMLMSEHEYFRPNGLAWEEDYSNGVRCPKGLFKTVPNDPALFIQLVNHYAEVMHGDSNPQFFSEGQGELSTLPATS